MKLLLKRLDGSRYYGKRARWRWVLLTNHGDILAESRGTPFTSANFALAAWMRIEDRLMGEGRKRIPVRGGI